MCLHKPDPFIMCMCFQYSQALHLSALLIAEEHRLEVTTFARRCLGMDGSKNGRGGIDN